MYVRIYCMSLVHTYTAKHNGIKIPSNCVELTFGMVHPLTFELLVQFGFVSWSNVLTLEIFSPKDS